MLFSPKEKGQGLIEYALILVLVAIVVIAALAILEPITQGVGRFIARYWRYGLVTFVIFFLADLCARLVMKIINDRY